MNKIPPSPRSSDADDFLQSGPREGGQESYIIGSIRAAAESLLRPEGDQDLEALFARLNNIYPGRSEEVAEVRKELEKRLGLRKKEEGPAIAA